MGDKGDCYMPKWNNVWYCNFHLSLSSY